MRTWIPRAAYDHPVTVLMGFLAMTVLGVLAYTRIPIQLMPEGFASHYLWVQIPFANATPGETDELVVRPVLEQLSTLSGIKKIDSEADSNSAGFDLEFYPSADMNDGYNDVVDRIERAMPELPTEIKRYWIYKFSPTDEPVLWLGVTFPDDMEDPWHTVEKVVIPKVDRVPGVATVDTYGLDQRRVFVDYDREQLVEHAVDLGDVQRKLQTDNFQMSGGRVQDAGRVVNVRSLARLDDPDQLTHWPARADGLQLGDFADVSIRQVTTGDIGRVNGRNAAALGIRKESNANTVDVTRAVSQVLDGLAHDPSAGGLQFFPFFDQGKLISESLGQLQEALIEGGVLSVLILWLFLREWRMTMLVSASIPFSLLVTVAILWMNGSSMNLVAMMGLMLAVGMVADDAIVVVEAIYLRRARGQDTRTAAIEGTGEVGLAILAATAASMVVFLPVILMTENADLGVLMAVLGLPVVWARAVSLLVAWVFMPLATRFVTTAQIRPDPAWLAWFTKRYASLLGVAMRRRADSAMFLLATLLVTGAIAGRGVKCSPGGQGGINDFSVRFTVPADATFPERDAIVHRFEGWIESHRKDWGVDVYRATLDNGSMRGRLSVYLVDDPPLSNEEVVDAAKAQLPKDIPGVTASIGWDNQSGDDDRVTLTVYGEDTEVLNTLGEEIARRVQDVKGVLSTTVGDSDGSRREIQLHPDKDALRRYGVDASTVGNTIAFAMRGSTLNPLVQGDDELEVETRLSVADRSDVGTLLDFPIFSPATQGIVPARALTQVSYGSGPSKIQRTDGRTAQAVTLDLTKGADKAEVVPAVHAALADMVLPRGYTWEASDWEADQDNEMQATYFALGMSVVFVYLLMGILFESWMLPLAILSTLPMAGIGAWWALYLTSTDMDTMAGLGLVVLVGVVVNNGIVLIDYVEQLRRGGMPRDEAIQVAAVRRLRPILMTAMTTIVGLFPMAAGSSEFVGIPYAPLGRTLMGGMITSTLLTLLFVPYVYVVLDDMRASVLEGVRWALRRKS